MKTYINAKLQIVRSEDDIVTTSIRVGDEIFTGDVEAQAPERHNIWD